MKIPILIRQRDPEYKFSYAIGCYPTLSNPHLATHPLSDLSIPSVKKELKEPDETGRVQTLGIYQQSFPRTDEERAEQLRNEHFVDIIIEAGGKDNPMLGFDHIRRDLILVAYEDINKDDFQQRVEKKLSKKDLKMRKKLLGVLEDVTTKLIDSMKPPLGEKTQVRDLNSHEYMRRYFRIDDILRRLAIHHFDNLPNVLEKDTSFIRNFYGKVQGRNCENLGEYLEEAQMVYEKAIYTRDTYGLTRDELIFLEGSAQNIIAVLKGEQNYKIL